MRWRRGDGGPRRDGARDLVEAAVHASSFADRPRSWIHVQADLWLLELDVTGGDVLACVDELRRHLPAGWDTVAVLRWAEEDPTAVQARLQRRDAFAWDHTAGDGPEPASFLPDDLLDAAARWTDADIDRRFDALEDDRDLMRHWSRGEVVDLHLTATERAVGMAPDTGDVPGSLTTEADLDRWLLAWELDHGDPPRDGVQDWFEPGDVPLLLWVFPRTAPFAAVAIEHWWASDLPFTLAALQRWHRRHGARLVAHFGTMLEVLATRCPPDPASAWALAREQHLLCDALLEPSGQVRRHLALGLPSQPRWFLHSRP